METQKLKYFIAIYDSCSITKAAAQCGIAQPALSQQLAVLEAQFKVKLFERSPQGVVPTPAGTLLYRRAHSLLWQLGELGMDLRQQSMHRVERVSVGLPSTLAAAYGLPLIKSVREKDSGIALQIVESRGDSLSELVESSKLSAAIVFTRGTQANLHFTFLRSEKLYFISPSAWHLPPAVSIQDIAPLPMILTSRPHTIRVQVDALFARAGLEPMLVAEGDSISVLRDTVMDGVAASILPLGMFGQADEKRIGVSGLDTDLSRALFLCSRAGKPMTTAEKLVTDCLAQLIGATTAGNPD
ncbi:MAG: LysR substrate-binding domain-containing protein [Pseudomonadota bacterium]